MTITELQTSAFTDLHRNVGDILDKQIFFVVGCQKSGTTWVQRTLDGHDQIVCRGEAAFAQVFVPHLNQIGNAYNQQQQYRNAQLGPIPGENLMQPGDIEYLFAAMTATMMNKWLTTLGDERAAITAVGEKTPEHALCLPLLAKVFPNVKVIHIIRDGRDVAVSGWFHNLRFNKQKFEQQFPTFAGYVEYLLKNHWLPYIQHAQQFGAQNPEQYFELRYEDLHANGQSIVRDMLNFLNVNAGDDAVARCCEAGSFKKLTEGRTEGEENRQSFFRKGVIGDWKETFDEAALQTFNTIAAPMMQSLGYNQDV